MRGKMGRNTRIDKAGDDPNYQREEIKKEMVLVTGS